jgi:hypothetical protein
MVGRAFHGINRAHSPGLLRRFYLWARGTEQLLVRPAADLPLVLISYSPGDRDGVEVFQECLGETWLTLPREYRRRYEDILESTPPLVVVQLRRRNVCTCLGHHHPAGTEGRLTRRLRNMSGVRTGELDLAYEAIRDWEPLPLSHLALPDYANASEEMISSQWQLALLAVFLHELHHLVDPRETEHVVRERSQTFYVDALRHFVSDRFGVEYGLGRESVREMSEDLPGAVAGSL